MSKLFPGSKSNKELTRQSGLLSLLQPGDSVMADRGFDIMEDLAPIGVRLNIPPFLRGKGQLDSKEPGELLPLGPTWRDVWSDSRTTTLLMM